MASTERAREEARRLRALYAQLRQALEGQDLAVAEACCRRILALAPENRDVEDLQRHVREVRARRQEQARQAQLADLYDQALAARQKRQWEAVKRICTDIEALDATYRDASDLRAAAETRLARRALLERVSKPLVVAKRLLASPPLATRRWIGATLGSIVIPWAFLYALREGWIAHHVPGAPEASTFRVVVGVVVGIALLVAFALLTARWSSRGGRASAISAGATVGLLAGGFTYATLGAPAAGAAGAIPTLSLMSQPTEAVDVAAFMDSYFGCAMWTYGMGWIMWLLGGTIGAIAGAVVGSRGWNRREAPSPSFTGRLVLSMIAILCCEALLASVPVYDLLASAAAEAVAEIQYEAPFSSHVAWHAAVGSNVVVLLVLLTAVLYAGWRHRPSSSSQAWYESRLYYTLGVVVVLTVSVLALVGMASFLSVLGIGLLAVGILGLLHLALGEGYSRAAEQEDGEAMRLPGIIEVISAGLVGATALASLVQFLGSAFVLNATLVLFRALPYTVAEISTDGRPPLSAAQVAAENYIVQMFYTLIVWAVLCVVFFSGVLLVRGLVRMRERRRSLGRESSGLAWSVALLGLLALGIPLCIVVSLSLVRMWLL